MSFNVYAAEEHRAILALGSSFGKPELKIAYHGLIWQWHPDLKFGAKSKTQAEATERTKAINVAYEFLSEVLELCGGRYRAPVQSRSAGSGDSWSWADLQPKRTYEGKTYSAGFPDPAITEIFLKSSHIVSTAYSRTSQALYIKFTGEIKGVRPLKFSPGAFYLKQTGRGGQHEVKEAVPLVLRRRVMRDAW